MRPATLLCGLALAGFFAWLAQPERLAQLASMPAASPPESDAKPSGRGIDPTPYRATIEELEAVLYRATPAEWSDPDAVSAAGMQLGERLYADLGPLAGRQALVDLVDFASEARAQAEAGFAAPELDGPRASWEALRAKWFATAPWFQQTTAKLVAAQRPPAPSASLIDLNELWKWAGAIESFVEGGRPAMERHGEVMVDAAEGSQAERDLVSRWQNFARDWDTRVRDLAALAPRSPGLDGEPNLLFAHQALGQAIHQLSLATTSEGDYAVPMQWWRAQCLDAAATHVEAARKFLAQARTGAKAQASAIPAAMPDR